MSGTTRLSVFQYTQEIYRTTDSDALLHPLTQPTGDGNIAIRIEAIPFLVSFWFWDSVATFP